MPDLQTVYRTSASFAPHDNETCVADMKPQDHVIQLKIEALDENKKATKATETTVPWPTAGDVCATSVRITDIIAAPQREGAPKYVAVILLAISWGGHAETSRYFAQMVKLP